MRLIPLSCVLSRLRRGSVCTVCVQTNGHAQKGAAQTEAPLPGSGLKEEWGPPPPAPQTERRTPEEAGRDGEGLSAQDGTAGKEAQTRGPGHHVSRGLTQRSGLAGVAQ